MKETRAKFIPPPTPKEDMKDIVLYIRRLNVLLPGYLDQLQKMMGETTIMLPDIMPPQDESELVVTAEEQYASTDSAGIV
jgi:hypothetical protein